MSENFGDKITTMIVNCEQNESIKKVESFSALQSQITDIFASNDQSLINSVFTICLNHLDHPLNTVAVISKSLVKKTLHQADKQKVRSLYLPEIERLKVRGYKSRFIGLNIIIDYVDPFTYLEENPGAVQEIMESTIEAVTTGKYVINFFESVLKKAMGKSVEQEQKWFDIWINEYLSCLQSPRENLREALLTDPTTGRQRSLTTQTLDQILTLLKIARSNKMLIIDETHIRLEKKCQESLNQLKPELPDFMFPHEYLLKLVLSENFQTCLNCIEIVAMEVKQTCSITKFEYEMANRFIKNCLRTTFPEFRQKYIKAIKSFIIRLRTSTDKDIRKYVASEEGQMTENVQQVVDFMRDIITFIQDNLYLDKPVEGALPLFEIFKIFIELFGDYEYKLRITQIYPPCHLISKAKLLEQQSFFVFLLNSLKSTWTQVRMYSYDILIRYPDNYPLYQDKNFINTVILQTALELANNPKAMLAEASALFFNLILKKCLRQLDFLDIQDGTQDDQDLQLQYLKYILSLIQKRVTTFQVSLIKEGKKEALLHGLLSFFKHLFEDFKINVNPETNPEAFQKWRTFFKDLLDTCLSISQVCKGLISNNGLMSDAEGVEGGIGEIKVDCRGHPIKMDGLGEGVENEDYENLILVGVWLAVKEDGLTLFNFLKWLDFPTSRDDNTKFIVDQDIHLLCDSFLDMLFNFKHRGAIEKAAETFSLFCQKLLSSPDAYYKSLPERMLDQALEKITTENLSTILRRSAGIPPTIIAILRAEPISAEPILLNKTLEFLLKLAQESVSERDDSKIHALNIMRFIFQDAFLRHDVQKFITPAMILATESFSSNSWSIRNSALMAFTALTKRILNNLHVQDQDLSRTKGLSVFEFLTKYEKLSNYFQIKLKEGLKLTGKIQKEEKEKQDLVIFSILLLISRLIPSFQLVENIEEAKNENKQVEEEKSELTNDLRSSKFEAIDEYVRLIKTYGGNATYFVRKISAQALLPLIKFDSYIDEIKDCYSQIQNSLADSKSKLRQNTAHGLFIRLHVFQSAYFQYRDITNKQLGPGHYQNVQVQRKVEEVTLVQCFEKFETHYEKAEQTYSRISIALYVKSFYKAVNKLRNYTISEETISRYHQRFQVLMSELQGQELSSDKQIILQQIARLLIVLNLKTIIQKNPNSTQNENNIFEIVKSIVGSFIDNYSDFVYTFLNQFKGFVSQIQYHGSKDFVKNLSDYVSVTQLNYLLQKDEKYCKVIENLLIISYKLLKQNTQLYNQDFTETLFSYFHKCNSNPSILSQVLKLLTIAAERDLSQKQAQSTLVCDVAQFLYNYSNMDHKEQVRIAVSKSIGKLIKHLRISNDSIFVSSLEYFSAYCNVISAMVLLLNDEQPDIRYYLCHYGLTQVIENNQEWTIQHAQNEQGQDQEMIAVTLNDELIQVRLFQDITDKLMAINNENILKHFANEFLLKQWILANPYRDHLAKNFEDKIFFFEPINKFYDLLWVKRIAFRSLIQVISYLDYTLISEEQLGNLEKSIISFYSDDQVLRQSSTNFEKVVEVIILHRLRNGLEQTQTVAASDKNDQYIRELLQ